MLRYLNDNLNDTMNSAAKRLHVAQKTRKENNMIYFF